MGMPLSARRDMLERRILPKLGEPIRYSPESFKPALRISLLRRGQGLEGPVAKRRDSRYEPGQRSGAWRKMRTNRVQEFVIAGYTTGGATFDALVFGYYEGSKLLYASRTRNGFTPRVRENLLKRFRGLEITECPFSNLPEAKAGRWGQGLTAATMEECRWLKPVLVGQFEFTEWTPDIHLRHSRFVVLCEDKTQRILGGRFIEARKMSRFTARVYGDSIRLARESSDRHTVGRNPSRRSPSRRM